MYACLKCGYVNDYIHFKERIWNRKKQESTPPGPGGFKIPGHSAAKIRELYFNCSNCNNEQVVHKEIKERIK